MKKKILITVGGTGGHIYPAQALAEKLQKENKTIDLLFAGGGLCRNRYFDRKRYAFKEISSGTLSLRAPFRSLISCYSILKGVVKSLSILRAFSPQVVIGFGSFHTFPMLLAAKLKKIPIVLHEANAIPGKVNRLFSPHAIVTGIHFPGCAKYLQGTSAQVGMPLRDGYSLSDITKEQAKAFFHLDPHRLTILIFGGSQGAAALNTAVTEALSLLKSRFSDFQVLHFTGSQASSREIQLFYEKAKIKAVVRDFETQMHLAWLAGDLAISRAGASSLAEQIAMEVPGILVPYPRASEHHQDKNADFMVDVVKGAVKIREKDLSPSVLFQQVLELVGDGQQKLKKMTQEIKSYKSRETHEDFGAVINKIIEGSI